VNIALVAFSRSGTNLDGSIFVFFIMTVAAAEVAVGLALLVALFKKRDSVFSEDMRLLRN
jgi:NADH-quinone oxidoreductase subunit K